MISLAERRRASKRPPDRTRLYLAVVVGWFAAGAVAAATLLGGLVLLAYRNAPVGVPAMFVVAVVACIRPARAWLARAPKRR